jgi:hypothetical protein
MIDQGEHVMAIYNVLSSYGLFDSLASFNGLVKDYLRIYPEDENKELFELMLSEKEDIYVYTNFGLKFNLALIVNKKIGYKDAGKIDDNVLKVPYIIYWKNENVQKAMIISFNNYIEAKGIFYCLTEVDNYFENDKNDLITIHLTDENKDEVFKVFKSMLDEKKSLSAIQKTLDRKYINDVDLMKDDCINISQQIFDRAIKIILPLECDDRKPYIEEAVARAFIIKKALYVRYMSNKHLLNKRHFGKQSLQRAFGKSYVNELPTVSYYRLLNMKKVKQD